MVSVFFYGTLLYVKPMDISRKKRQIWENSRLQTARSNVEQQQLKQSQEKDNKWKELEKKPLVNPQPHTLSPSLIFALALHVGVLHVHADDLERCYLTPNCQLVCDDDINIFDFCTIKTMLGKERTLDKNCGLPGVGVYIGTSNPYMLLLLAPYLFTWYFLEKRWCVPVFSFKCLCACTHSKHAQHTLCACTYITCNLSL